MGTGTFGSFTTATLGVYAAQKGLDVTGNNIANINTKGYTRQELQQSSLISSVTDKYFSEYTCRVGQGVVTGGVRQIRDEGLDLLYRGSQADVGAAETKLEGLDRLAAILDEVGKGDGTQDDGVILNQLNDLRDLISSAITNNGDPTYDSLIRGSADSLCQLFNKYAQELSDLETAYEEEFDQEVDAVNSLLDRIKELNQQIESADIRGSDALELRDERNRYLDELSKYVDVDIKYSEEEVANDLFVEKLTITLAGQDDKVLIDGKYGTELHRVTFQQPSQPPVTVETFNIELLPLTNSKGEAQDPNAVPIQLGDNDLHGAIQSYRELLTETGEYSDDAAIAADPNATIKRGIPYYKTALDHLARTFAEAMNELNNPANGVDGAGNLFSNSSTGDDADGITAANISVSKSWAEQEVKMLTTTDPNGSSGQTENLAKFLEIFSKDFTFAPVDVGGSATVDSFEGSLEDMLLRIQSKLGQDQLSTTATLTNHQVTNDELYTERTGVSGVDLNEEATGLMIYQKAYAAACRLMTTLDEALDILMAM